MSDKKVSEIEKKNKEKKLSFHKKRRRYGNIRKKEKSGR
jgi:hypothetical protein